MAQVAASDWAMETPFWALAVKASESKMLEATNRIVLVIMSKKIGGRARRGIGGDARPPTERVADYFIDYLIFLAPFCSR